MESLDGSLSPTRVSSLTGVTQKPWRPGGDLPPPQTEAVDFQASQQSVANYKAYRALWEKERQAGHGVGIKRTRPVAVDPTNAAYKNLAKAYTVSPPKPSVNGSPTKRHEHRILKEISPGGDFDFGGYGGSLAGDESFDGSLGGGSGIAMDASIAPSVESLQSSTMNGKIAVRSRSYAIRLAQLHMERERENSEAYYEQLKQWQYVKEDLLHRVRHHGEFRGPARESSGLQSPTQGRKNEVYEDMPFKPPPISTFLRGQKLHGESEQDLEVTLTVPRRIESVIFAGYHNVRRSNNLIVNSPMGLKPRVGPPGEYFRPILHSSHRLASEEARLSPAQGAKRSLVLKSEDDASAGPSNRFEGTHPPAPHVPKLVQSRLGSRPGPAILSPAWLIKAGK